MPASVDPVAITVGDGGARVSGLLMRPSDAPWLYLLAHGAGAGMRHPFLETIARALAGREVAMLRYQFPYMEQRAEHLARVRIPMLFLQGDRDEFADLTLLQPVVERLGERATLRLVEGGDHSFKVLKRTGKTESDVMGDLVCAIVEWTGRL